MEAEIEAPRVNDLLFFEDTTTQNNRTTGGTTKTRKQVFGRVIKLVKDANGEETSVLIDIIEGERGARRVYFAKSQNFTTIQNFRNLGQSRASTLKEIEEEFPEIFL